MPIELKEIIDYYLSLDEIKPTSLELRLLETLKEIQDWNKFSDKEKQEKRGELINWYKIKFPYEENKSIIEYEESVLELCTYINKFLSVTNDQLDLNTLDKSKEKKLVFRLRNMLLCEKELAYRLPKIRQVGHVAYEVVAPLFEELMNSEEYVKYDLNSIKITYERMWRLHSTNPYER